eukprot:TRINITY_DN8205_c0_g1_i1.p1 TRINITY_DN8205_c0_g1~~TRINITY_DN8205_c0_g1_i1.p1  ORF type:complete len:195 (-),score=28.62 TRINITY_DN8205_c0_g1_i1:284-868(-)
MCIRDRYRNARLITNRSRKVIKSFTHPRNYASLLMSDSRTLVSLIADPDRTMRQVLRSLDIHSREKNYQADLGDCVCVSDWCALTCNRQPFIALALYEIAFTLGGFKIQIRSAIQESIVWNIASDRLIERLLAHYDHERLTVVLVTHYTDRKHQDKAVFRIFHFDENTDEPSSETALPSLNQDFLLRTRQCRLR